LQFQEPTIERYAPIEEKVEARQSMGRAYIARVYEESCGYGWPAHFIYNQVDHWYAFGGAQALKTPARDPFIRNDGGGYITLSIKTSDPSIASLWTIYWPPALLQIGLLQIIATLFAGAIVFVSTMIRRKSVAQLDDIQS
jgi:hypothetical protein